MFTKRQESEECAAITANLGPILEPCKRSTRECLASTSGGFGTISFIQQLICPAEKSVRENIYDVLVDCRGQDYADLIYAGICGSMTTVNDTDVNCIDAILSINDGSSAKEACCQNSSDSESQCASALQRFSDDLDCCTATIAFQFYFQDCGGLAALFQANQVELPPLCNYTIYSGSGSLAATGSVATLIAVFVLSVVNTL